ncbi:hypothetical protein TNCV_172221 [Trichonephila clavipes]|nr:hypothetical protein TNCV_172221 [Trichonephila clavipes]
MNFRRQIRTSFRLRETSRYRYRYLSPFISRFTGWTNVHPVPGILSRTCTYRAQAMIRRKEENANASCTTIGPPLLKSRPTLQAQVSKIKKFRVPDRGLKAAGTA